MKVKKFLTAVLAAALAATSAALPVLADEIDEAVPETAVETVEEAAEAPEEAAGDAIELAEDPWTGGEKGKGTQDDPYQISSEADLMALASFDTTDKYFKLTQDITLVAPWITKINFNGTLTGAKDDGTNCAISNLTINTAEMALFNENTGTISNIDIKNASVNANRSTTLVHKNKGTISGCTSEGTVNGGWASGLVFENTKTIENCINYCDVTSTSREVNTGGNIPRIGAGGIAATNGSANGLIKGCKNYGTISSRTNAGGIAAINSWGSGYSKIENCENYGDLALYGESTTDTIYFGGIAGELGSMLRTGDGIFYYGGSITGCKNYGKIDASNSGSYSIAGGIIGLICLSTNSATPSEVSGCYNAGPVTATKDQSTAGGIVGQMTAGKRTITGNSNIGKVTSPENSAYGAIIGRSIADLTEWESTDITVSDNTYLDSSCGAPFSYMQGGARGTIAHAAASTTGENGVTAKPINEFPEIEATKTINAEIVDRGNNRYDIVLNSDGATKIYRFMSAELNLKFTGELGFEVVPNEDLHINMIKPEKTEDGVSGVYEFNLDGSKNEAGYNSDITAMSITVASVMVSGYGTGTIELSGENSVVNTAKADGDKDDNIVTQYTAADETLVVPEAMNVSSELEKKTLRAYIVFPNSINKNVTEQYNNMKLVIDGTIFSGVEEPVAVKFGESGTGISNRHGSVIVDEAVEPLVSVTNDWRNPNLTDIVPKGEYGFPSGTRYTFYSFSIDVPKNNKYTLTFSAAGYRTYSVDATVEDDTAVVVWNNAMDNPRAVVGKLNAVNNYILSNEKEAKETFLAGDIDDSKHIDIYDLSAAVAYFGKGNLYTDDTEHEFVRYDLNRDGNIDSKDIAMVLVSWGK